MEFSTHILTHAGGRETNQDFATHFERNGKNCWVLADGLGGMGGGEEASRVAAGAVVDAFRAHAECSPSALLTYFEMARSAVVKRQQADPALAGMRTTLVVLVSDEAEALWGHVGDSRLYHFSGGRLRFQTRDHSVPQAMVDAGRLKASALRFHEDRNRLLRSVGGKEDTRATVPDSPLRIAGGDAFLLASDGFWEYVTEVAMEIDLAKAAGPEHWLRLMHARLRTAAPPEQDNYTAIAIFAHPAERMDPVRASSNDRFEDTEENS